MNKGGILLHCLIGPGYLEPIRRHRSQAPEGVCDRLAMSAKGGPRAREGLMAVYLQPYIIQMGKLRSKEELS